MAYQLMASLYDQFMEDAPYDNWVEFTKKIIEKYHLKAANVIDLGCGTGEITLKLAKEFNITGVDYSTDMLTIASQKANEENVKVNWIHQDLRELEGLNNFDLAISYCDVINYITTEEDVQEVFLHVSQALNDHGIFIFDVHSIKHVVEDLIGNSFSDVTEDSAYIWTCYPSEIEGEMFHELTFFKSNGNTYERFDESHHQRTFPIKVYQQLLNHAGFEILAFHRDFLLEDDFSEGEAERIFVIAQKRTR
ncbi:class I SAM-dependent DNA methyltransferase [Ornithinibacillus sp. 179-J 7C1 HS]|uniref:class I SAM-dependent DNA methyltransferase n=1 Tax=Ornithinibacillus sp. 179-J 7C1 HS TaxID=3142384 RepID=UPI0039A06FDE